MHKTYMKENLIYRMLARNTLSGIPNEEQKTFHSCIRAWCTYVKYSIGKNIENKKLFSSLSVKTITKI